MPRDRTLIVLAVAAGILLLIVAATYAAEPARSLPGFFPGHEAGSGHHHTKHAIAAAILALGAFVLAWFRSGPRHDVGRVRSTD